VEVSLTEGRWLETTWDFDSGYYWDDKELRIGSFLDKALAMELMSDPTTWFMGRDTAADIRQYQLSYYTNFRDQMLDLFGGLIGDQVSTLAPYAGARCSPDFDIDREAATPSIRRRAARVAAVDDDDVDNFDTLIDSARQPRAARVHHAGPSFDTSRRQPRALSFATNRRRARGRPLWADNSSDHRAAAPPRDRASTSMRRSRLRLGPDIGASA
jgi:hypothetical protein